MTRILFEEVSKENLQKIIDMEQLFTISYEIELEAIKKEVENQNFNGQTRLEYLYGGDEDKAISDIYEKMSDKVTIQTTFSNLVKIGVEDISQLIEKIKSLTNVKISVSLARTFVFLLKFSELQEDELFKMIWHILCYNIFETLGQEEIIGFLDEIIDNSVGRLKFFNLIKTYAPKLLKKYDLPENVYLNRNELFIQVDDDIRRVEDLDNVISREIIYDIIQNYIFDYDISMTCEPRKILLIGMNKFFNWFGQEEKLNEWIMASAAILSDLSGIDIFANIETVLNEKLDSDNFDFLLQDYVEQAKDKLLNNNVANEIRALVGVEYTKLNDPYVETIVQSDLYKLFWEHFPTLSKKWYRFLGLKEDGSLKFGIELVHKTYFHGIAQAFEFLDDFYKDYDNQKMFFFDNETTGLHTNISLKTDKPFRWNFLKGILLLDELGYVKKIFKLAGREFAQLVQRNFMIAMKQYVSDMFKIDDEQRWDAIISAIVNNIIKSYKKGEISSFENSVSQIAREFQGGYAKSFGINLIYAHENQQVGLGGGNYIEFRYPGGVVTKDELKKGTLYFCHLVASMVIPQYEAQLYFNKLTELITNILDVEKPLEKKNQNLQM